MAIGSPPARQRSISLIIPARNEARLLSRLLASVSVARARYVGGADSIDIVVADNGSTDQTTHIARAHGCEVIEVIPRTIAAVRNGGAAHAAGACLAFIDADMQLHPETFNAIATALNDAGVIGGTSRIEPERWSAGIGVNYALICAAALVTGIDAGLIFTRREDFVAMGGFDERRSALEDLDFLWRLRRRSAESGRRMVRLKQVPAVFSTRKFDEHGDWHWMALGARVLRSGGWRRATQSAVVRSYWYDGRDP